MASGGRATDSLAPEIEIEIATATPTVRVPSTIQGKNRLFRSRYHAPRFWKRVLASPGVSRDLEEPSL